MSLIRLQALMEMTAFDADWRCRGSPRHLAKRKQMDVNFDVFMDVWDFRFQGNLVEPGFGVKMGYCSTPASLPRACLALLVKYPASGLQDAS